MYVSLLKCEPIILLGSDESNSGSCGGSSSSVGAITGGVIGGIVVVIIIISFIMVMWYFRFYKYKGKFKLIMTSNVCIGQ